MPRIRSALITAAATAAAVIALSGFTPPPTPALERVAEVSQAAPIMGIGNANEDPSPLEQAAGMNVGLHRIYYVLPGDLSAAMNQIKIDQAKGRIPWVSFKLRGCTWVQAADGCADSWVKNLNTELAKLDPSKQVWVTIHHEPETDEPTAGFAPMQDRLLPLLTAPNIRTWIILCGWHETFDPRKIYTFEAFWPKTAKPYGIGIDPYNWYGSTGTTWDEGGKFFPMTKAFADSKGVKWAVAEFGIDTDGYNLTSKDGQHWIDRAYADGVKYGALAMAYFDTAKSSPPGTDWRLISPIGKQESFIKALKASVAANSGTGPTPTPTPSPTPTPTPTPTPPPASSTVAVNLRANMTGSSADLQWDAVNGATGYQVFKNGVYYASLTGTRQLISNLSSNTSYSLTVRSTVKGVWYQSAPLKVTTGSSAGTANTPTGLRATMTNTSADLYWNAVPNATTYQVFKNGVLDVFSSNAHELVRSLTPGTRYTFIVKAKVGASYYESEPITVTTTGTAP
ncbi:fibronectin type III domain-containing protein [Arthrobacter sp. H14-L1]|uniref:fibronectin type III domain-containing protein n=1 Tax=Arthrobacter sp. H14-L1 TaxID=2996697 RepID=UPI00226DAF31|nr:fibronectin type III domain-containing protein [Arthrobacter sp. H14-L1]MCY0904719.1 fibronectin type III domain-containing protein [Arthrobacter sp. H14-L1]